jgi:hypothetical protein
LRLDFDKFKDYIKQKNIMNIALQTFYEKIIFFEKIYSNFSICHVHPNNLSGLYILDGVQIPSNIEVTFIRNDLIKELILDSKVSLPHFLDKKNSKEAPEIKMPEAWWKK